MLFDNGYLFLCFLPLAKLWTGAFISTQPVSCHTVCPISPERDLSIQNDKTCSAWEHDTRAKSVHDLTKHDRNDRQH